MEAAMDILEFKQNSYDIMCSEDEELPDLCTQLEKSYSSVTGPSEVDKNETKRVKNCHRERCRVQKLNSSLHHLNMLLPQTQRSPGNGKHFSKAIILETCSDFIYQLENHVFDLFFDKNDTKDVEDKFQHSSSYLSSLLSSRRARHCQEEHKDSQRIKRPKNSFILFSMGQRKQLLKENPCLDNNKVSKILGEKWKNLDAKSKSDFNELAKIEKSNHKMKFPHFNYTIKRKRPRPITKKAVDNAVTDYMDRDGSFCKLKRLIHKFPPTFSLRDILLSSCSEGLVESRKTDILDFVKIEDETEYLSDYQHDFPQDSFLYPQAPCPSFGNIASLPDIFSQHNPYGWSSPFDENIYLHHALTATKCGEYLDEYPEYTTSYMGLPGIEESLITPKEEFEYDKDIPELVGSLNPDYIAPSLFYYPLSPAQIFSQIEPHSNLPLFTLPPISQLISNEN